MKSDTKMGGKSRKIFPVVGIGASAGGLNALHCFVGELPKEFGFAVVFIQHLSPKHKSLLPDLLRNRRPDIGIVEISDGMKLRPGKIYLSPAGKKTVIAKGAFHTIDPSDKQVYFPIDEFFTSLAGEAGEQAVAVILSGAGTDGARGVEEIRNNGGAVFVQEPGTAEFPSMPLAAINTGRADGVLPPDDIAQEILKLHGTNTVPAASAEVISPVHFDDLLRLVHDKTGYRFNHYKKNVLSRRIIRRMHLRGVSAVKDYISVVADKDSEAANLAADLMIGVTSFFRDRLAWKALKIEVIKKLAASDNKKPLRIWTPACSTGEEAYSIAMMLRHEFDFSGIKREIQVFATDLNDAALEKAREGRYPADITADVPPDYMNKFFTCSEDGLSVIVGDEIRGSVVFARQDLLTDPPFSQLDLIICRNLMIYLEPEAQEKCIALFHYALREGGYLFLGNAETPGRKSLLFKSLAHKKYRIYQKIEGEQPAKLSFAVPFTSQRPSPAPSRTLGDYQQDAIEFIQHSLLEVSGPAAVAVNQHFNIVYNNGPTNRYLRQPRGAPTQNLLELLPGNLRNRIRGALYKADREATPVSIRLTIPKDDKKKRQVALLISKLRENLFLVIFRERRSASEKAEAASSEAAIDESAVHQLENELSSTRAELQSNIEQLKGLNEELQSSNEELQAANEELETSREELQSLNEELITVNAQLQSKIEEEEETNNDLHNFLSSTNIPTVFLDHRFRVKRFTPAISKLLKLIPSDVGRPIIDMSRENLGPDLIADVKVVLDSLTPVTKEISIGDKWYIRATLPYRTADNRIEGVVITYNDVSDLKRAEERTRHLASFPQLNPSPVLEVDVSGSIVFSNEATEKILTDLDMDRSDTVAFLPKDIKGILEHLEKKKEQSLYREIELKDRVYAEIIYLAPQFNVARIYAYEITKLKRAEGVARARLRMLETFYKTDISLDDMLRMALDEIETQTQSTIGFYHFVEPDQETLSLQNWSTNTLRKMCTAEGKGSHYPISEAGIWVDCVRQRRPVIHNDYAALPGRKGMPPGHAEVVRELVIPVLRSDRIVAIIGVGNKPTDYNETDVDIASQLGDFSWEIIERKRTEEALHASWDRSRSYIEVTGQLGWTTNADGEVIEDMPTWRAYTGQTYDGIKGWGWADALHPDDLEHTSQVWRNAVREKSSYEVEYRIRRHDGIYRHFMARGIPVFKEDGSVREWVGTCIDISERMQAEQALRKSEEKYHSLFENMTEGFAYCKMVYDSNGSPEDFVYLDVNMSFGKITGLADVVGRKVSELIPGIKEAHPELLEIYGRVASTGRAERFEIEFNPLKMWLSVSVYSTARGYFVAVFDNITERKKAEWELLRLNKVLKALSDSSQAVIRAKDEQEYLNDVCRIIVEGCGCKMAWIGFAEHDEARSVRPMAQAGFDEGYLETLKITWADTERGRGPTGTAIRTGKMAACRNMLTDPAFTPWREEAIKRGYASSIVFPLISDEVVIGAITIYSDQADPFSEGDIRSLTELADNTAYGITVLRIRADREKLNEDMAVRNVELEMVNKELEAFIYSISHDLRAPIRTVAGFARFLEQDYKDKLDEQARDYIKRICAASGKITLLIDDLLRLAKISRQEVARTKIDLTKLAHSVTADLREAYPERSVEVVIAEGLTVFADRRLMEIVLSNLLGNAWKFTSKTENARIEFGMVTGRGEKSFAPTFFVRDNGAGFDPKYTEKMFWPFQRLHSESEFEGTGIGLTIVERIVHRHGGKVWAEGEVGKGATVYFTMR